MEIIAIGPRDKAEVYHKGQSILAENSQLRR